MNQARRTALNKVIAELQNQSDALSLVIDEEQEAFDNMPEGLQQSEKGQQTEENLYVLRESQEAIEEIISQIENTIGG
jgi:hypothetical protein